MFLKPLFICRRCGVVSEVEHYEIIDSDRDEVFPEVACARCGSDVLPKLIDGQQDNRSMTPEEIEFEMFGPPV
jgi:DNA-directed RNA polymerase subunit RPC12/RpoP